MMGTDAYHQIPATDFSNVQSHNSAARSNGYVQPPSYSGAFPASSNMLSGTVGPSDAAYMIHGNHGQAGGAADTLSGTIGPADTGKDFLHIGLMTTRGPPAQGARGVMATRDALDAPAGCTTVAENFGVPGTRPVLNSPCAVHGHRDSAMQWPHDHGLCLRCSGWILQIRPELRGAERGTDASRSLGLATLSRTILQSYGRPASGRDHSGHCRRPWQ